MTYLCKVITEMTVDTVKVFSFFLHCSLFTQYIFCREHTHTQSKSMRWKHTVVVIESQILHPLVMFCCSGNEIWPQGETTGAVTMVINHTRPSLRWSSVLVAVATATAPYRLRCTVYGWEITVICCFGLGPIDKVLQDLRQCASDQIY